MVGLKYYAEIPKVEGKAHFFHFSKYVAKIVINGKIIVQKPS